MQKKSWLLRKKTELVVTMKDQACGAKLGVGVVGGAVLLVLVGIGAGWSGNKIAEGRFLPGSKISKVEVGGLTNEQALEKVSQMLGREQKWVLSWGTYTFDLKESDIAYVADFEAGVARLRQKQNLLPLVEKVKALAGVGGKVLEENISYRIDWVKLNEFVAKVAETLDIPAQEPQVLFDPEAKTVAVTQGENGRRVDAAAVREKLLEVFAAPNAGKIAIPVVELKPRISEAQALTAKERAWKLVDKSVTASVVGEGVGWTIGTEELISWIDPASRGWKQAAIDAWVEGIGAAVDKPAQNASFKFVAGGKVEEFKPEKKGLRVIKPQLRDEVLSALTKLEKTDLRKVDIDIPTQVIAPRVTAGDVNELGIRELIGKGESWYAGSITNRIFNLKKAAEAVSGSLISPGETFSFNKTVGEISQATGYKPAFIIKGGKTILGDGGGVCQTSSTLFRAVLDAGLPIEERVAHAYRVSYYEQNYQPGFDATVFQPAPDFRFTNDTPGHVLVQMVFDEQKKYLAFELYGTSDGRRVEISKVRVWDVVSPPPDLYIDDPNLPAGKVVQTERAAKGAKVAFDWKVTRNGEVLQEKTFFSNYRPWQAVYLRGTKI